MEIIKSVKNELIEQMTELSTSAGRRKSESVPLYGLSAVEWAHKAGWIIEYILISESSAKLLYGNEYLAQFKIYYISDYLNKKITGVSHIIDVCGAARKNLNEAEGGVLKNKKPAVVLDKVLDHGNIGTIIRTMRCFGFDNLIMTDYGMDIYYKNIVGASRGESFNVNFANINPGELISHLRANGYKIISTRADCDFDINDIENAGVINLPETYAIIFGNEENGISDELLNCADFSIGCRLKNNIDSLNVGVAAGIILNKLNAICEIVF